MMIQFQPPNAPSGNASLLRNGMRHLMTLMALLLSMISGTKAWAQAYTENNVNYYISGSEAYVGKSLNASGDISILSSITVDGQEYSVTKIGFQAFLDCTGLTSVSIPSSVTTIEGSAFSGCTGLTSIHVASNNECYNDGNGSNCIIETSNNALIAGCMNTVIPSTVKSIGAYAFCGCTGLTSVSIPSSVKTIGEEAFLGCTGLTSITIPSSVTSIGTNAFLGCTGLTSVSIPSSVTEISNYAFWSCSGLTSISIPGSVTTIGEKAFYKCDALTTVIVNHKSPVSIDEKCFTNRANATLYVPDGRINAYQSADYWKEFKEFKNSSITFADRRVKQICIDNWDENNDKNYFSLCDANTVTDLDNKFQNNTSISSFDELQYFTGLTEIGTNEFRRCTNLKSVVIPENVKKIDVRAFSGCKSLVSVNIPQSVTTIGSSAFDLTALTSITIPSGVSSIGGSFLSGCASLETIIVSSDNTVYNDGDGSNCVIKTSTGRLIAACKNTVIPEGVKSIDQQVFKNLDALETITIPASMEKMAAQAFYNCTNLTSVIMQGATPPTITDNTFCKCDNMKVYVPKGALAAYQAADHWKDLTLLEVSKNITFADNNVKALCVAAWDTSRDGELSESEAAAVTDLGEVFKGSTSITSFNELAFFTGLTTISANAFSGCSNLTAVTIPENVTTIGENAFSGCGLTAITIPENVTSIAAGAFDSDVLTEVTVCSDTPATITATTFTNRKNATLNIPTGSKEAYQAADYWNAFSNIASPDITFEDENVKNLCLSNWDTDEDGELSEREAAAVTSLGEVFCYNEEIVSFDELRFFTGLTSLANCEFMGCYALESVTIPKNVAEITNDTFIECPLTSLKVDDDNSTYDSRDGCNAIIEKSSNTLVLGCKTTVIPNDVTAIGKLAFYQCSEMKSLSIPSSVVTIGDFAFLECTGLTSVTIPSNVQTIGTLAFSVCSGLESVTIGKGVTGIGDQAFYDCTSLSTITVDDENTTYDSGNGCNAVIDNDNTLLIGCKNTTIPDDVTAIGDKAFSYCQDLTAMVIPASVKSIGDYAFESCGLTAMEIPASVKSIGEGAFYDCYGIATLTLNEGLESIGENAFYQCCGISTLEIPAGVKSISDYAFDLCNGLTTLIIPASVEKIGTLAFGNCESLTQVYCYAENPPTTEETAFRYSNNDNCTLYVPEASVETYQKTAPWSNFYAVLKIGAGITTGINEELRMKNEESVDDGWYDLQGRKVDGNNVKKGVYIHNGKKIIK